MAPFWHDGKLWIASLRLRGILRVDPTTWQPEFFIPFYAVEGRPRYHGIAWDDGTIWLVTGNDSHSYAEGRAGLVRYDAATGKVLETADFAPGSCDPHGLAMHDGALISCDAGLHPGWPPTIAPPAAGSSKSSWSRHSRLRTRLSSEGPCSTSLAYAFYLQQYIAIFNELALKTLAVSRSFTLWLQRTYSNRPDYDRM